MPAPRSAFVLACTLGLGACASSGGDVSAAIERGRMREAVAAYEQQGKRPDQLERIAAAVIEREAWSGDAARRERGVAALPSHGAAAERVARRLASGAHDRVVRAQALSWLARNGDAAAQRSLREQLDDADADVRAAAIGTLDPVRDVEALRAFAEAPAEAVRLAAVRRLARAPADDATRALLVRMARFEPPPAVRVAVLQALPPQGEATREAIEAQLEHPQIAVRLAAIDALVELDATRAAERLAAYLSAQPTLEGVEAARMLLAHAEPSTQASARALLERALAAEDQALRGAAAVALMSLPDDAQLRQLAIQRAPHEHVRGVRLCLALALGNDRDGSAALSGLLTESDVVAGQAAAELARRGDADALRKLKVLVAGRDRAVRRVAAAALGGLGLTRDMSAALLDADPSVRLAAASAILAA